ncbi:MAG TPA: hypothetical protein PK438_06780 [Clostridia bacterium]|jgi:hypothetical protein|nr:MAG: hypothetical protein BWY35_00741 [Firmicutes bacterium ADurb.Bin248]HOG01361.1 hypothetical protein [Clostridia bacterium]HOS18975.1 hypothetical protein [Clostridia bacterium]HPK15067.1 hypothetical protein [Clostridia bacterium]
MARRIGKRNAGFPWWGGLLVTAAVFLACLTLMLRGIERTRLGVEQKELALVERAVNRAVVSCYAMEGFYPPGIDYLIENYGLEVDQSKYYIHHEAFASNVYPTIWVARR